MFHTNFIQLHINKVYRLEHNIENVLTHSLNSFKFYSLVAAFYFGIH